MFFETMRQLRTPSGCWDVANIPTDIENPSPGDDSISWDVGMVPTSQLTLKTNPPGDDSIS